jgi:hypothetical protein
MALLLSEAMEGMNVIGVCEAISFSSSLEHAVAVSAIKRRIDSLFKIFIIICG